MSWFKRSSRPDVATRLTRDEALALAREAAAGDSLAASMGHAVVGDEHGKLVWTVASVAIDAELTVVIDDATGAVLDMRRISGLRR